jgi:hypothetical protein
MKRILIIAFIVLFFIALLAGLLLDHSRIIKPKEQSSSTYHLTQKEMDLIRDGDIILRHGYGYVSDMIVRQLNEKYDISHCAIICKSGKTLFVIHSVSQSLSPYDGVQSQDLEPFIRDSRENSIIIVRYQSKVPGKDGSNISRRAKQYLDEKIPFDNAFNLNDSTGFYCQELPYRCILNEFGDDIFNGRNGQKEDPIHFTAFLDISRFKIILNHHDRR